MCKVSIVIPVYKVDKNYFKECIDSLRNQTLDDLEFILVDDCGNDDSIDYAKKLFYGDSRAKFIYNETNQGAGYSRNAGIQNATGEFVGFVDADDFVDANFYKYLYYSAKYHDSDIVKGVRKNISTQELSWLSKQMRNPDFANQESVEWFNYEHWSAIYRRDLLIDNLITYGSTRVSEDVTFLLKANYFAQKVNVCLDATYFYRDFNDGSLTSTSYDRNIKEYLIALTERIEFLNSHKNLPEKTLRKILADYLKTLDFWKKKYIDYYYGINVSVIVPMYNCADYIDSLFDCLLNQTLKNIEIICVDDGSEDTTADKVKFYMEADNRISYYYQENMGAGAARNLAIEKAKGAYMIFLDADDLYDTSLLEKMFRVAEEQSADVVHCLFRQTDFWKNETVENLGYRIDMIPNKLAFAPKEVENLFLAFTQGPINKLFRRQFIIEKDLRFSLTRIANDIKFTTLALVEANKIACIRENLLTVRRYVNNNSISSNRNRYLEHSIIAYRELYESLTKRGKIKLYERQLCSTVGDTIYYNGQYGKNEKFINEIKKWLKQAPWNNYDKKTMRSLLHLGAIKDKEANLQKLLQDLESVREEDKKALEIKIMFAQNQLSNIKEIDRFVEDMFIAKSNHASKKTTIDIHPQHTSPSIHKERIENKHANKPFLIRKLLGAIQCCKDHGILYTIKYSFRKGIKWVTRKSI